MNHTRTLILALMIALLPACSQQRPSTVGSDDAIEKRIDQLLARMTLSEKIGQMNQVSVGGDISHYAEALRKGQIGSILNEVDPAKLKAITYDPVNHTYIQLGKVVGKAFSDGKKLR